MHAAEELVRQASEVNGDLNQRQLALINHALERTITGYTVKSHRVSHGVSYETSWSDLLKLVKSGLLTQRESGKAHVFLPAPDLRQRLSRGTQKNATAQHRHRLD